MSKPVLNFITGNANKLREVKAILEPAGIEVRNQSLDLPEIQGTLEEVTREKCRVAAAAVNGPVLVEDTCLCFDALNGLPGPYMCVVFFFPLKRPCCLGLDASYAYSCGDINCGLCTRLIRGSLDWGRGGKGKGKREE